MAIWICLTEIYSAQRAYRRETMQETGAGKEEYYGKRAICNERGSRDTHLGSISACDTRYTLVHVKSLYCSKSRLLDAPKWT